ncbi:MAG: hypothetical protein ACMXYE_01285 [Candidatus Woesearchaeota archaeon]
MAFESWGRNNFNDEHLVGTECIDDAIHYALWTQLNSVAGKMIIAVPVALDFNEHPRQARNTVRTMGKPLYLLSMEDVTRYDVRERRTNFVELNVYHTSEKAFEKRDIFFKQPHYMLATNPQLIRDSEFIEIARFMPARQVNCYVDPSNFLPMQVLGEYDGHPVVYFNPNLHLAGMGKAHYKGDTLAKELSQKNFTFSRREYS